MRVLAQPGNRISDCSVPLRCSERPLAHLASGEGNLDMSNAVFHPVGDVHAVLDMLVDLGVDPAEEHRQRVALPHRHLVPLALEDGAEEIEQADHNQARRINQPQPLHFNKGSKLGGVPGIVFGLLACRRPVLTNLVGQAESECIYPAREVIGGVSHRLYPVRGILRSLEIAFDGARHQGVHEVLQSRESVLSHGVSGSWADIWLRRDVHNEVLSLMGAVWVLELRIRRVSDNSLGLLSIGNGYIVSLDTEPKRTL